MSFDFVTFQARMAALTATLPAMGQLIQAAEIIAPKAAGLSKAGIVINTLIAAEPVLVGMEQALATMVTAMVTAYRSAGTLTSLPPPVLVAPTPVTQPVANSPT